MDVPDIEILGVAVIASLKGCSNGYRICRDAKKLSSESVSVRVTVGGVLSSVITILSFPAYVFPARSVPVTVTV
jgi:phage head maturation protease